MGLFGKKKEPAAQAGGENAAILILGGGCSRCNALEAAVKEALSELGRSDAVGHVTDFAQIAAYGVMSLPALMIDGTVVSSGSVLSKDEAKSLLQNKVTETK